MTFKNKKTGHEIMGNPVEVIMQLSTHPAHTASFVLYESMDGHGFFLREAAEFVDKFKAVAHREKSVEWAHKIKGGSYRVHPGLYLFDGDDVEWDIGVHDGHVVKAYIYRNGDLRFTNDFSAKFEARGVVKMNFHTPDAAKFKATRSQIETQIAAAVKKANNRADHPYVYVSEHAIPVPKWSNIMPPKSLPAEDGFITVWYAEPFHVALVSRHDKKDVRIRGDNLAEVMKAAELVLWSKQ